MGTRVKESGPRSGGETVNRVGYGPITRSPQVRSEEAGGRQARRSTRGLGVPAARRWGCAASPQGHHQWELGSSGLRWPWAPLPDPREGGRAWGPGTSFSIQPGSSSRALYSSGGTWLRNTVVIAETYARSTGSSHHRRVCKAERRVQPSPERPPRAEGFRSPLRFHPKPGERGKLLTAAGPTDGPLVNR